MLPTISLDIAEALIRTVVNMYGEDFVYNPYNGIDGGDCYYVPIQDLPEEQRTGTVGADSPKRQTGCLIGTALKLYGVSTNILRNMLNDITSESVYLAARDVVKFTDEGLLYFQHCQTHADDGHSWGDAANYAARSMTVGPWQYADSEY